MISTTPHGALQILHAAYAATYRQVAINHQLEAYRHPGHDLRASAHLELIQLGGMRQGQARQRAKKLGVIKGGLSQPFRSTSTRE
jgi:hypothetical protein